MIRLLLDRLRKDNEQTLGVMLVYLDGEFIFSLATLELGWHYNKKEISCISPGVYKVLNRWSKKYGHHLILEDVEGRTFILIHSGNYKSQTEGCILVGLTHADIDKDGFIDVSSSKKALKKLLLASESHENIEITIK